MNLDKIVCNCMSVTNGMIKDAVDSGADTLEEVQEAVPVPSAAPALMMFSGLLISLSKSAASDTTAPLLVPYNLHLTCLHE